MKEIHVLVIAMLCITAIILASINHSECLTGHDIDAKIANHYNNPEGE